MLTKRFVQLLTFTLVLVDRSQGSSNFLASLHDDFQTELQFDKTRQVKALILEKQGLQLIHLDTNRNDEATNKQFAVTRQHLSVLLRISNVTVENAGRYSYSMYYVEGTATEQGFSLQVHGFPKLYNFSSDSVEGDTIHVQCCVESSSEPTLTWRVGTEQQHNNKHMVGLIDEVSENKYCGSINFTSDRAYNNRNLSCQVESNLNLSESSRLSIMYQPLVSSHLIDSVMCTTYFCSVIEFTNITVVCTVDGNPTPNVTLERISDTNASQEYKYRSVEYVRDSSWKWYFIFVNITRHLQGTFKCKANNGVGSSEADPLMLNVMYPSTVQMLTAANVTLMSREDNVTFICKVRGNPRPSVYLQMVDDLFEWRNVDVKPLVTPNITTQIWKFFLSNEHNNITGRYRCISNNTVGGIALSNIVVVAEFKDPATSNSEMYNSWIVYLMTSILTCLIALLMVKAIRKKCSSRYSVQRNSRQSLPRTPTVALQHFEAGFTYSSGNYQAIIEGNSESGHLLLRRFDRKDVTFIAKLNQESRRERWLCLLHKGTMNETYAHMMSYSATRKQCEGQSFFFRHIASLPSNENIVNTFGIIETAEVKYCLQEYLSFGTVKTLLETAMGKKQLNDNTKEPVQCLLLTFSTNVISGLKFLHQYGWMHPGLSSEKLLVSVNSHTQGLSCKLYDFCYGMSVEENVRQEIVKNNGTMLLNMPPEVERYGFYTRRSDIWAAGVVLWEIFSFGAEIPTHSEIHHHEDVFQKLNLPDHCPRQIYDALSRCWQLDQNSRISLDELLEQLTFTRERTLSELKKPESLTSENDIPEMHYKTSSASQSNIYCASIYKN